MTLFEVCFIIITISIVTFVIYAVFLFQKTHTLIENINDLTTDMSEKSRKIDDLFERLRSAEEIFKYIMFGFDFAKNMKNKKKEKKEKVKESKENKKECNEANE